MEWEGKLIYEVTRRQAVKCTSCIKSCSVRGVCHVNVMLLWVCARTHKQLKLNATLYNSARIHTFALEYKWLRAYVFSPKYNRTHTHNVSLHHRCVFVGRVSGKSDRFPSKLE